MRIHMLRLFSVKLLSLAENLHSQKCDGYEENNQN